MKTKILLAFVSSFIIHHSAFSQGALTPPGAPAPTMRTLAQLDAKLDPRTAITNTASAVTILQPGSYYLAGNLTVSGGDAITIATNGVTLDLNGFTISSTAASAVGNGILLSGTRSDISILNGHIRSSVTNNGSGVFGGSGFAAGIYFSGSSPVNVLVAKVSVSGCLNNGIYLDNAGSAVVENCTVRTAGNVGIAASTVKSCVVADCGGIAIYGDQVSDSRGAAVGNGNGIFTTTAQNCNGYAFGNGTGILATIAQNCNGYATGSGSGLNVSDVAIGSRGVSSSGTGLIAFIAESCRGSGAIGLMVTHNVNSF